MNTIATKPNRLTWSSRLLICAAAAVLYVALARLGLKLASIHGNVSPVWPATGMAIWLLIQFGRGFWPAILVGAFVANALTSIPLSAAAAIAIGNTLEAVAGAWLWQWGQGRWRSMQELRELTGVLLASLLGPVASATVGVATLFAAGAVPVSATLKLWATWWTGDSLGALTVFPALLVAPALGRSLRKVSARGLGKLALLIAIIAGVSWLAFMMPNGGAFLFAIFPVLLLGMIWFDAAGAKWAAVLIALGGISAAYFGHGPFATGEANQDFLNLQVFLAAVTITALVLPVFGVERNSRWPVAVLLFGWTLSGWIFATAQRESLKSQRELLAERIAAEETRIRARLATYEEALRGGVSLMSTSAVVSRAEWRVFAETLQLEKRFPGIDGIGVVYRVKRADTDAFLQRVRADGAPDFAIHGVPGVESPSAEEHYVITFLEPEANNRRAIGLDLASEANRRVAATRARDTREPWLTGHIILVQDALHRPGFLLMMPFYRKGAPADTVAERQAALEGWVDVPFVAENFLRNVLRGEEEILQLYFFAAGGMDREHLLYPSANDGGTIPSRFVHVTAMGLAGQQFQLGWQLGPKYPRVGTSPIVWVAATSAFATLLLAGLVTGLQTFRQRAEQLASERTAELEKTQGQLALANLGQKAVLDGASFAIISTTTDGTIVSFNATAEKLLGYNREELIDRQSVALIHVREEVVARAAELSGQLHRTVEPGFEVFVAMAREGKVDQREWTYVRKDGTRFPVLLSVSALRDMRGNITGFLGTAQDLSQQKQIALALQNSEERLQQVLVKADCLVWEAQVVVNGDDWNWRMIVHPSGLYRRLMGEAKPTHAGLWYQFNIPEQAEMNDRCRRAMLDGTSGYTQEFRLLKDGQTNWIRESVSISRPDHNHYWLVGVATDITHVKEISLALERSEEDQRRLVESVHDYAIFMLDPAGRVASWNGGAERTKGYTSAEIIGRSFSVFYLPEDIAAGKPERKLAEARESGRSEDEGWRVRKDGSRFWANVIISPVRDPSGELLGFAKVTRDITDRKQAESVLNETRTRLEKIFASLSEGLVLQDARGGILECNAAAERILGLTRDQMNGRTSLDPGWHCVHDDGSPFPGADHPAMVTLRTGEPQRDVVMGVHRADGSVVWIEINTELVGRVTDPDRQLVCSFRDVTARRASEAALRASELRLQSVLGQADCIVWEAQVKLTATDWEWTYVYQPSRLFERICGERLPAQGFAVWDQFEIPERPEMGQRCRDAFKAGLPGYTQEFHLIGRNQVTWLREVVSITQLRPGEFWLVGVMIDITERKQLEENLARSRDQALEASRLKSEFLSTMSHEIRTPMNAVIGMTGLLADTPLSQKQQEMTRTILGGAEHLLAIINDLLDFSRIEAGKMRIDPVIFSFNRVLEETVTFLAPRAHEKHLELTCEIVPWSGTLLVGDSGRVRQILTNLIGNAIKFTDDGEVGVTVRCIRETGQRTRLHVAIRDTGVGIPRDAQRRLFQPFVQADGSNTRRFGGTGLGLAITRQLIELMGGEIGFESTEGAGSCFWFELEFNHGGSTPSEPPFALSSGRRILIVDDNETNRRILETQLSHLGMHAEAVSTGDEAMMRLTQIDPWDLVLLDWQLQGASGIELARAIRSMPEYTHVPLVLMSSASLLAVAHDLEATFAGLLTKPVSDTQLKQCLLNILLPSAEVVGHTVQTKKPKLRQGLRLLLVEDNLANQRVATLLLEKMGCEVDLASNGLVGLERLAAKRYHAVLMDCQMPVMDGYEATRHIRAGTFPELNQHVPIIAMTAYAREEDRTRCLNAGMNDYVSKPIRESELDAAFERCGLRAAMARKFSEREPARMGAVFDRAALETTRALPGLTEPSLLSELVKLYLSDESARLQRMEQLVGEREDKVLSQEVHSFGGNAASFGAIQVREVALDLEEAVRLQDWTLVGERLVELREACARLRAEIAHLGLVTL